MVDFEVESILTFELTEFFTFVNGFFFGEQYFFGGLRIAGQHGRCGVQSMLFR